MSTYWPTAAGGSRSTRRRQSEVPRAVGPPLHPGEGCDSSAFQGGNEAAEFWPANFTFGRQKLHGVANEAAAKFAGKRRDVEHDRLFSNCRALVPEPGDRPVQRLLCFGQ